MNKRDWHEFGLRLLGIYFIIEGLASLVYTLCDRLAANSYMGEVFGMNRFLFNMGVWPVPVIYFLGGTFLLLYAQNFAKQLVEESGPSSSVDPMPAFSLWIKLIGLYFAFGQVEPIGRLWGSLGVFLWAPQITPESPVAFRTIHEIAPEMAHYMRIELFVHVVTLAICVMFIVKSRKIAAKLMCTEVPLQHRPEDGKRTAIV